MDFLPDKVNTLGRGAEWESQSSMFKDMDPAEGVPLGTSDAHGRIYRGVCFHMRGAVPHFEAAVSAQPGDPCRAP